MIIYVMSLCLDYVSSESFFHFKGYYAGVKIKKIIIKDSQFTKGEAYLLKVKVVKIENGLLYGSCLKSKELTSL